MENSEIRTDELLLYDPLFETPPDTVIRDKPGKGFWGKAVVRKTAFILVLLLFVGFSIALSFGSLTKAQFRYEEIDGGYMLSECNTSETDSVLTVDCVLSDDGVPEPEKPVVTVREWAFCCDENVSIICIGKGVREIANTSFYSCTALLAVVVDPENPLYCASNGVLYRMENGSPTELMLYPARSDLYRAMLALGEPEPTDAQSAEAFAAKARALDAKSEAWKKAQQDGYPAAETFSLTTEESKARLSALRYAILPGTERIGEMAFAECADLFEVTIPEGVREIASMAFFKCTALRTLRLPDSTEIIGSDAFSSCAHIGDLFIPVAVRQIGHHAFYGCDSVKAVRMACSESDMPETGQDWAPKERRFLLHDVPVLYGEERGAE